jgi:hypothetical protein
MLDGVVRFPAAAAFPSALRCQWLRGMDSFFFD